jgi:hypothetical protein
MIAPRRGGLIGGDTVDARQLPKTASAGDNGT